MSEVTRGVKFILRTETAADYAKAFGPIHAEIDRLQKRMNGVFAGAPTTAFAQAQAQMAQVQSRMSSGSSSRNGASSAANDAQEQEARARRSAARLAEFRRKGEEDAQRSADRMAKLAEKANAEVLADTEKTLRREEKLRESAAEKERKRLEREAEQRRKAGNRQLQQLVRSGPQAQQQDRARAEAEHTRRINEQREAYHRLGDSIGSTLDGVTRLGEGLAYLGLVGEKDVHQLTDALLEIRGVSDSIRGTIQSVRDAGSMFRALRDYRSASAAVQGLGGVGRLAGMMGTAAHAAGMAGTAGGTGGIGMAGAAAAPVGAYVAAGTGVVAAITSAVLTGIQAHKHGLGGGADYGSAVDKVATWEVGIAEKLANFGHGIGMSDNFMRGALNHPMVGGGLGYLFAPAVDSAAAGRKTERMQERYSAEKKQRAEMDANVRRNFAERMDKETEAFRDRQQAREFRGQMTATGDTKQDLRARMERLAQERQDMQGQHAIAQAKANEEKGPDGAFRNKGAHDDAVAKAKEINEQILQIDRQRQLIGKELLNYQKEGAAAMAKTLSDKSKGQQQDIGKMNRYQVENLNRIARKQQAGQKLSEHELETARNSPLANMRRQAEEETRRRGMEMARQVGGPVYDQMLHDQELARDARRKENLLAQEQVRQQNAFDRGQPTGSAVPPNIPQTPEGLSSPQAPAGPQAPGAPAPSGQKPAANDVSVNLGVKLSPLKHDVTVRVSDSIDDLESRLINALVPQVATALVASGDQIADAVMKRVQPLVQDAIRRQNNQGRQLAS